MTTSCELRSPILRAVDQTNEPNFYLNVFHFKAAVALKSHPFPKI